MIDHTGVSITDPARSRLFYEQALEPLGYQVLMEVPVRFVLREATADDSQ